MNQEYEARINERYLRLEEWKKSEEYLAKCALYRSESEKLCCVGLDFITNKTGYINDIESSVVRTVIGSNSSLHRGIYCPSPIYDVVVGNTKRGKQLKRLTAKIKAYYIYGFDESNRLRQIKRFYNGVIANSEYLFYDKNKIYGITLLSDGWLQSVTEETHQEFITNYDFALVMQDKDKVVPLNFSSENYCYDNVGLYKATMYRYSSVLQWHSQREYLFERENGYLSAYRTFEFFDYLAELTPTQLQSLRVYKPLVTRSARFNPFSE